MPISWGKVVSAAKSGPSSATPAAMRRRAKALSSVAQPAAAARGAITRQPSPTARGSATAMPSPAPSSVQPTAWLSRRSSISTAARSLYMRMRLKNASATFWSTSSQKAPSAHWLRPSAWILPCGESRAHHTAGPGSATSRPVTTSNSSFCASGPENRNGARDGRRIVAMGCFR